MTDSTDWWANPLSLADSFWWNALGLGLTVLLPTATGCVDLIYIYIYMYLLIRGEFILAQWYSKVVTCPVGPTPGATAARTTVRGPTPLILSTVEALNKPHPYLIVIKRVLPLSYWHDPVWIRLGFQTWGVFVRFSSGVSLIHASGMERIHYSDPSFNGSILLEPVSVRIHWPYVLINLTREIIDWFCFWGSQRW